MNGIIRRVGRADAVLLLATAVVVLSVATAAIASRSANLDDRARAIDGQLRCPTCRGLSIADSPATSASQMRALVREQLARGASDDEIRAFFVSRYGRWILLDPPLGGPDLALWLAPVVIMAIGATLVVRRARARERTELPRRWTALPTAPAPRLSTVFIGGAMALALAVPIVAAVGPRVAGREVSGGTVPQTAPSIEELEALVALGDALLAANRAGDAADRYKAVLGLDPNNIPALLGVGAILLAADRPDAAGPAFDRVLTLFPDQPDALLYHAVARLRLEGRVTQDIRRDIERFLEVASSDDPRRPMAQGLLDDTAASPAPSASSGPENPEP